MKSWLIILCCLSLLSLNASAAPKSKSSPTISKAAAVKLAQRKYAGKVLRITKKREHWQIKMLMKNGKVLKLSIDQRNGRIRKEGN